MRAPTSVYARQHGWRSEKDIRHENEQAFGSRGTCHRNRDSGRGLCMGYEHAAADDNLDPTANFWSRLKVGEPLLDPVAMGGDSRDELVPTLLAAEPVGH